MNNSWLFTIRKEDILTSLELMDIKKGDVLLVHSALSSIGRVEGSAETVIDAFIEAVGEEGTVVMSTLTGWSDPFDADSTPSAVGLITEKFRQRPQALRSLHPVHSVAAIGKYAEYITKDHDKCETGCGEETPYLKIRDLGGKIVLLGVDMDRNTMMHSLEEEIDADYLLTLDIPAPTYISGYKEKMFTLRKFPPGHRDFLKLTPYLRRKDAIIEGKIGNAVVKLIDSVKLFDVGLEVLKKDPMLFICHNVSCNFCNWARKQHSGEKADPAMYSGNGCVDDRCEICVI